MKKFINNFRLTIKFIVVIVTSREFAFIYCVIGTIAQIAHTFYLVQNISSLNGNWKIFQSIMLATFISSSLLYFTAIATNEDTDESRKINNTITLFTIIEILINLYYYSHSLLISNIELSSNKIFDYIFAVLISCMIPITIKLYSSHIRAKEWVNELMDDKPEIEIKSDNNEFVNEQTNTEIETPIAQQNNIIPTTDNIQKINLSSIIDEIPNINFVIPINNLENKIKENLRQFDSYKYIGNFQFKNQTETLSEILLTIKLIDKLLLTDKKEIIQPINETNHSLLNEIQ